MKSNITKMYGQQHIKKNYFYMSNNSIFYQLDAQILYFLIHLLHSSTRFEHYYAHPQEVSLF